MKTTTWPAALGVALVVAGCSGPARTPSPCGKDTDCKGPRVCVRGDCVDPAGVGGGGGVGGDRADPVAVRGPRPFAMLGGDAAHRGRGGGPAPLKQPSERWRVELGAAVSGSPTLGPDGTIYVIAHDGVLRAIAADGAVRWTFATGERSWSTPAVAEDGTVYVGSDDDHLYAVTAAGALAWKLRLGTCTPGGFGPESSRCDADGGPVIGDDGTIYLGGDAIHAVWPDGTLRWRFATGEHVASAPALATVDGELVIYAGSQDDALYALAADGTKRWELRVGGDLDAAPAVGEDGTIYIGSDDDALHAVNPDGSVRWKLVTGGDIRGPAAIAPDGTIYVGSYDKHLYAVAPSGQIKWRLDLRD